MTDADVRPYAPLMLEADVQAEVRAVLLPLTQKHGPARVGRTIDTHEKTVRAARDEQTTLNPVAMVNLLSIDPHALDGFLRHFGRRSVPVGSRCDTDGTRQHESKVLHAALAMSIALADDDKITIRELQANKQTLTEARDALDELLARLEVRAA